MNYNIKQFSNVVLTCAFVVFAIVSMPTQAHAQSFSYTSYPQNGFSASVCGNGFCGGAYQYNRNNYGYRIATNTFALSYQYGAPTYYYVIRRRPQYRYTSSIPYVVIQQRTPTYYRRADPYAFQRDYNQAIQQWDAQMRYYNSY